MGLRGAIYFYKGILVESYGYENVIGNYKNVKSQDKWEESVLNLVSN
jgi:hypothetical protein